MREQVDPQDLGREKRQGEPDEGPDEHDGDLSATAGQAVEQEPPDVGVDPPSFLGGFHDRAELVVGQDQVGGLPGDLGAALAHGHADVSPAQRRAVVDPVTRHRDDVARRLAGLDDRRVSARAWPGRTPALHRGPMRLRCRGSQRSVTAADDAEFGGDGAGGGRVVSGDEQGGDSRRLAGGDRRCGSGAGRVENGDQAEQAQPAFQLLSGRLVGSVGRRDGQDPEAVPCEILRAGGCLLRVRGVGGDHTAKPAWFPVRPCR